MTRTVTVTVQDLDLAVKNTEINMDPCAGCLLAVAFSREFRRRVEVGMETGWTLDPGGHRVRFPLPLIAQQLISLFDNEAFDELRALLPSTFVMEIQS